MLISQETHDKVECFFEKLFDFEQRVESRCQTKQTKLKDSLHISQFVCVRVCVCAAVEIRDWKLVERRGREEVVSKQELGSG